MPVHKRPTTVAFGFTAAELLVVMVILAILIVLAVPSFPGAIKRYRIYNAAMQLSNALQLARAEAIRARGIVGVGPKTNDPNCTVSTGTDWHCGVDVNNLSRAPSLLIKTIPATALEGVNVQFVPSSGGQTALRYNAMGGFPKGDAPGAMLHIWPAAEAAATSFFTYTVCTGIGENVKVISSYTTDPNCRNPP